MWWLVRGSSVSGDGVGARGAWSDAWLFRVDEGLGPDWACWALAGWKGRRLGRLCPVPDGSAYGVGCGRGGWWGAERLVGINYIIIEMP